MRCVLLVAVLALAAMLALPAGAMAAECSSPEVEANGTEARDWPAGEATGRCVSLEEWDAERAAAQQAHESQEASELSARQQKEASEQNAREQQEAAVAHAREASEKKETGGPPKRLHVTVSSVHGSTYRAPGHTLLLVETEPFAEVTFRFTYPQHPSWKADVFNFKESAPGHVDPAAGENDAAFDPWSCRAPMLVEDWEVQVRGENDGLLEAAPALSEHGTVLDDISAKWCKIAKRRQAELARRRSPAAKKHK